MSDPPARSASWLPLVPVAMLFLFALNQAVRENNFQDFAIYRAGAEIGLRGESPYDTAKIRAAVERQFPGDDGLANNAGFFQPPGGVVVFAPFALLPYPAAKVAWAALDALAAAAVLLLLRTFADPPGAAPRVRPLVGLAVGVALCLNLLTAGVVVVGQTTLLAVGCVAAGQWAFENRRPAVGTLLWAVPFVKPHVALALLPLAWYLGGWKRAAGLGLAVGLLTLAGCLLAGGSPLFLGDYLRFLADAHKGVEFNRVALNSQITSWNRLLVAAGGPAVELDAVTTLAGYAVWYALVAGRCVVGEVWPSPAWAAAASAVGALVCCQVLGYEALLLALVVPWLRDLFLAGRPAVAGVALALIAVQVVPFDSAAHEGGAPRALAVAGLAVVVLACGPRLPNGAVRTPPG